MPQPFDTQVHGFHFPNGFINPVVTVDLFGNKWTFDTFGRCGGMAYLSLDYYFRQLPIPTHATSDFPAPDHVPADQHVVPDRIMERLLQSFSDNFFKWLCFFAPTLIGGWAAGFDRLAARITASIGGTQLPTPINTQLARGFVAGGGPLAINLGEIGGVRQLVRPTKPVPMGLVESTKVGSIGSSHVVVAFDFKDLPGGKFQISIYDNRFPEQLMQLVMDAANPTVIEESPLSGGTVTDRWIGFFVGEAYADRLPEGRFPGKPYLDLRCDLQVPDTHLAGRPLRADFTIINDGDFPAHFGAMHVVTTGEPSGRDVVAISTPAAQEIAAGRSLAFTVTLPNFGVVPGGKAFELHSLKVQCTPRLASGTSSALGPPLATGVGVQNCLRLLTVTP